MVDDDFDDEDYRMLIDISDAASSKRGALARAHNDVSCQAAMIPRFCLTAYTYNGILDIR